MSGNNRRLRTGRHGQVLGIAEAGNVVADARAGRIRRGGNTCPPRVDRQRQVESGPQCLDGRYDTLEFLSFGDLGPRPGFDAAHVEKVGAVGNELFGQAQKAVEIPIATLIEE